LLFTLLFVFDCLILQPQVNIAKAAAAAFTAVALMAAPVFAAEDVKSVVCASNPTAKICLKGSAK
jgi:hypothetical protein